MIAIKDTTAPTPDRLFPVIAAFALFPLAERRSSPGHNPSLFTPGHERQRPDTTILLSTNNRNAAYERLPFAKDDAETITDTPNRGRDAATASAAIPLHRDRPLPETPD